MQTASTQTITALTDSHLIRSSPNRKVTQLSEHIHTLNATCTETCLHQPALSIYGANCWGYMLTFNTNTSTQKEETIHRNSLTPGNSLGMGALMRECWINWRLYTCGVPCYARIATDCRRSKQMEHAHSVESRIRLSVSNELDGCQSSDNGRWCLIVSKDVHFILQQRSR